MFDSLRSIFHLTKPATKYQKFFDPLENFSLEIPTNWKYDRDVAVVDNKYSITFTSSDNKSNFTIYVDAELQAGFDFKSYAKEQLESASSGVHSTIRQKPFRELPAYFRSYRYTSGGNLFLGGGVLFFAGILIFSISWNAPEKQFSSIEPIFKKMLDSFDFENGIQLQKWKKVPKRKQSFGEPI